MTTQRLPTETRRAQLTDAALGLLHREGAKAVTVANIAKQVGITSGAVFRHFPSTQALFDAAVERFDAALPPLPDLSLEPRERIGVFFIERVVAVRNQPEILGLSMSDRLETLLSESGAARLKTLMNRSVRFLKTAFTEAKETGLIDESVSVETLVWMTTGAMRGAARSGASAKRTWADVDTLIFGAATVQQKTNPQQTSGLHRKRATTKKSKGRAR